MKKRIAAAVLGLVLLGGSGCHPWYLVKSQVNSEDWKERLPEITATRAGKAPRPLKLAILAPDECSTRSGAEASGEAVSTRLLLRNRCGVVMAELERAMVIDHCISNRMSRQNKGELGADDKRAQDAWQIA